MVWAVVLPRKRLNDHNVRSVQSVLQSKLLGTLPWIILRLVPKWISTFTRYLYLSGSSLPVVFNSPMLPGLSNISFNNNCLDNWSATEFASKEVYRRKSAKKVNCNWGLMWMGYRKSGSISTGIVLIKVSLFRRACFLMMNCVRCVWPICAVNVVAAFSANGWRLCK